MEFVFEKRISFRNTLLRIAVRLGVHLVKLYVDEQWVYRLLHDKAFKVQTLCYYEETGVIAVTVLLHYVR
jgi:hypothetical protein